ncbi:alternative ribosome rescue factor ArfA [Colwellia echini]|uniref:Alternative ribosome-rescue factor A n=1 Tax=Colwellia echini TaxID=1982103 RepID=A0ABY3MUA5_9GAMM|nr:alternative ribosome rescue factor ArfA [Colwellia echini]TYK64790.1 alternative ribosome-rescue factor A [Colwellia echini]
MSNKKKPTATTDLGRGEIKNNFLAALVTSKVYKMQVVKAKKGKGSYQRKAKNNAKASFKNGRGGESYLMVA